MVGQLVGQHGRSPDHDGQPRPDKPGLDERHDRLELHHDGASHGDAHADDSPGHDARNHVDVGRTGHLRRVVGVLASASWRSLGTGVELLVNDGDIDPARKAVVGVLEAVDRTYSRFRPDSELSAVNAAAGRSTVISALLAQAISAALRAAQQTNGLVDPTVGRAMRLIGYDEDFSRIAGPRDGSLFRFESVAGWQVVHLDVATSTLVLPRGVELDLGSTGKALAADLAAQAALAARAAGGPAGALGGVLVSLGGDIAVAGVPPKGGWRVLIAEDSATRADAPGEVIALHDGALATSSTTVRRWIRNGQRIHHLVDPRTGRPADGPWRTASVTAATCVEANTAATASIVAGAAAEPWLAGLGLAARLVSNDGAIVRVGAWPVPRIGATA